MRTWAFRVRHRGSEERNRVSGEETQGRKRRALSVAAARAADFARKGEQRGALVLKAVVECIREWHQERGSEDVVT
jgi:hypothetical protein